MSSYSQPDFTFVFPMEVINGPCVESAFPERGPDIFHHFTVQTLRRAEEIVGKGIPADTAMPKCCLSGHCSLHGAPYHQGTGS